MDDWDNLRYFLATARAGSVTAAAAKLGVNHSTVSRRISAFEEQLGARLFDRLPTGYALTPLGEEMCASTETVEAEIAAIHRSAAGRDVSLKGSLRVTAPKSLTAKYLMPHLAAFTEAYPDIELFATVTNEFVSLSNRDADIAIRSTKRPPENLVGRRLAVDCSAIYAADVYLERHNCTPKTITDSLDHTWIWWDGDDTVPRWIRNFYPRARLALRIDAQLTIMEAAKQGIGMAQLPCGLADLEPGLRRIPPFEPRPDRDIWILTHPDLRRTSRVRAFMDFFANAIAADRDLFEGKRPIKRQRI